MTIFIHSLIRIHNNAMANKSKQELLNEFQRDYSRAISFYKENDLIHFNRDIRPAIENFCRLLIYDIIGECGYHDIENNVKVIDETGRLVPQSPGRSVESSTWIVNAKNALGSQFAGRQNRPRNLKEKKIKSGLDQLNAQYSEASETSLHSGSEVNEERMRYQANLCVATFPALFLSLKDCISPDLWSFLSSLPKVSSLTEDGVEMSSVILEKENALSALDDYTQGFKRQGGIKFIAILPENASSVLGKSLLRVFFKIRWSLVIDFNPDDTSADTLFASAPATTTQIVTNAIDVTDGSVLLNWMFAKGRKSLSVLNGTQLLRNFPSEFKQCFSQMVKAGSTDDYIIVSFCDSLDATVLTRAFDKLEEVFDNWDSVEKRCRIVCLSKDPEFSEKIASWGEAIAFKPYMAPVDIKDFVNHLDWKMAFPNTDRADGHQLIRGKSFDVTDAITRYKAAGIEFFGPHMAETTSSSYWDFYSGAEINWQELENNNDANRDLYIKVKSRIIDIVKNNKNNVRVFTLKHRPGSGGSTMARRLAYDIYKEDEADILSCVPIQIKSSKNIRITSDYLSKLSEDIGNACILAVVESKNVGRSDFDNLVQRLASAKKRVVFFYLEPLSAKFSESNQSDVAFLDDVLKGDESRFVAKYKAKGLTDTAINNARGERRNHSLEVIDFPLLLKEDMSSESLSNYVTEWVENLPENIKTFVGYVGFVAHYSQMGLNQNLVRATWRDSSSDHYTLKGYDDSVVSAIYKLLIEEYSGDEPLGIWRPRYNKFADHLIKAAWGENWRIRLPEIAKRFILLCSQSGQLGNDDQDMLHSLFIIRRDVDFRAEDVGRKNKFSSLINDLEDPERAASIFKCLVEAYPDDAVFHGHYARFLYERASSPSNNALTDDKLFQDAQEQLNIAFEINPYDADLYHMQGMLIRRQISALKKEFSRKDDKSIDYVEDIHSLMTDWVKEALEAFDKSIEFDPSSPYGYAASCQLLREAIEFGKILLEKDDFSFCEKETQYSEYVDELGYRLDQFEQVCYSFKENALALITPSLRIYNDVRVFHRDLIGCGGGSIIRYRDLYSKATGEMKGIYGDFLVKSILYSKANAKDYKAAYQYLKDDERKEIESVLQQKRSEGDLRCYDTLFKLYRYGKKEYPIDSAIDLLRDCESQYQASGQKGWGYLNACYYLAVCYSALAIHGNELSFELVNNARKYFDEATNLAHIFEQSTINSFCYLGDKKDIHCIVDKESDGMLVSGIIMSIENNKGIMRMKCGLEASFNAKGMDKFKYQGKPIQGIIGFKYSGIGLYQFGDVETEVNTEEEIEEIISNSYVPDFTDTETIEGATSPASTGLRVLGKMELPESRQYNACNPDRTYSGVYDKASDSVKCQERRYPLKVRTTKDVDLYDGADVLFEIGSEPHKKDPSKIYKFAINVRIKA